VSICRVLIEVTRRSAGLSNLIGAQRASYATALSHVRQNRCYLFGQTPPCVSAAAPSVSLEPLDAVPSLLEPHPDGEAKRLFVSTISSLPHSRRQESEPDLRSNLRHRRGRGSSDAARILPRPGRPDCGRRVSHNPECRAQDQPGTAHMVGHTLASISKSREEGGVRFVAVFGLAIGHKRWTL